MNLQARRDLWRNCLHGGFPHVQHDPRGYGTGNKVRDLRKLRNRVSHMDSLLYVDVQHQHDLVLLPLLNSINRELRDWVVGAEQGADSTDAAPNGIMTYRRNYVSTQLRLYVMT